MISEIDDASFLFEVDAGGVFVGLIDAIDDDPTLTLTNDESSIVAKLNVTTIRELLQALGKHQVWNASKKPAPLETGAG